MDLRSKYGIFQKVSFEKLYVSFLGLKAREQIIVMSLAGVLAATAVLSPIVMAATKLAGMRDSVSKAAQSLQQINQKIDEVGALQQQIDSIERQFQGRSQGISSTIEAMAQEAGLGGAIDSIKERPSRSATDFMEEQGVDIRISKVGLEALVTFLHGLESHQETRLKVKSLQIKPRFKQRNLLDANVEVVTYTLKREER